MSTLLAHAGAPLAPHDLWSAWNRDAGVLIPLLLLFALYHRGSRLGRRAGGRRRRACFSAGFVAVAVALVSPLDAWSDALASAHMVQHVLLILVAAPLFALSAPGSRLLRGAPLGIRRLRGRVRRRHPRLASAMRLPTHPAIVWLLHVATLWLWHSAAAYDAALADGRLHALEHATFLLTAVWFWRVVLSPRRTARAPQGMGLLLVFGMAMQSVFLSVLLTFAREHWYGGYTESAEGWGLTPLADQQLAGVLMWVPAGAIYLLCGLVVLARWMRSVAGPDVGAPDRRDYDEVGEEPAAAG